MKVIEGTADPKDQKRVLFQLTPKGEELDHFHRLFDEIRWDETRRAMREHFTDEEIDCAFSVLRFWCTYMALYCLVAIVAKKIYIKKYIS